MINKIIKNMYQESRRRKFALFMKLINPGPEDTVIDVGAEARRSNEFSNFFEQWYPYPERLTAASYENPEKVAEFYPGVKFIEADGRDLPFPDKTFDIAISNAVLEHVGDREDQRRFVHEMCRVARRCFITTPNKHFPVELHSRVPFVQYMPAPIRNWLLKKAGKTYMIALWGVSFNLLSAREFRSLFPEGVNVRIISQRLTLVPETIIAVVEEQDAKR